MSVTHWLAASPERVFDAWLDPLHAGEWLFATGAGSMVRLEIDARPGGKFLFVDRRPGPSGSVEDIEHHGTYVALERPHHLVFDFSVPRYAAHADRVTVHIAARGRGSELTLSHELAPAPDGDDELLRDRARDGWNAVLEGLAAHLESSR
ncbi:MAG: SRPBCC domain-containing protein [Polyangiaceae bacterium]